MLARQCLKSDVPDNHVCLGLLCSGLGLIQQARKEFDWAERLGFENIDRFRAFLKRQPDSLK
jgi:hypothetical protein